MIRRGRLVAIEGGEGSGKTTQARRLAERMGAVLTREPGGTALGEEIRGLLLEVHRRPIAARTELLLMVAARAQHVAEVIGPALDEGRDVVTDRFAGSTLAYQAFGRGLPLEDVEGACRLAAPGLEADVVVLLDVPPDVGAARRSALPDRIEAAGGSFHERVRDGFLALAAADPAHWVVVDGTRPADELADAVWAVVVGRLGRPEAAGKGRR